MPTPQEKMTIVGWVELPVLASFTRGLFTALNLLCSNSDQGNSH